jgi:hypothetical protein
MPVVAMSDLAGAQRKHAFCCKGIHIGNPLDIVFSVATLADDGGETVFCGHLLDPSGRFIAPQESSVKLWATPIGLWRKHTYVRDLAGGRLKNSGLIVEEQGMHM